MKRAKMKPRNPYVVAALHRKAGAHRKTNKAKRRHDKVNVRNHFND